MKEMIANILKEMGIKVSNQGYYYIIEAIELINLKRNKMHRDICIAKDVYTDIAKEHNKRPGGVERSIRYAIETLMLSGNREYINKIFGNTIDKNKGKPSNSEFLYMLADYIELINKK